MLMNFWVPLRHSLRGNAQYNKRWRPRRNYWQRRNPTERYICWMEHYNSSLTAGLSICSAMHTASWNSFSVEWNERSTRGTGSLTNTDQNRLLFSFWLNRVNMLMHFVSKSCGRVSASGKRLKYSTGSSRRSQRRKHRCNLRRRLSGRVQGTKKSRRHLLHFANGKPVSLRCWRRPVTWSFPFD